MMTASTITLNWLQETPSRGAVVLSVVGPKVVSRAWAGVVVAGVRAGVESRGGWEVLLAELMVLPRVEEVVVLGTGVGVTMGLQVRARASPS